MTLTVVLVGVGLVVGGCLVVLIVALGVEQMLRRYSQQRGLKL